VVPQSWFNKNEPTRGDLHHLFACEARCNGFRGNTPYAEFADFPEVLERAIRADCGRSERNGFESVFGKGAAARVVFYFLVRYPEAISVTELPQDRLSVLWRGMGSTRSRNGSDTVTPSSPDKATATRSSTITNGPLR
jgi:endonuclease I